MGLRCVRSGPTATTPKPSLGECWKGFKSFFREPRVSVYEKVVTWGIRLALAPLAACLMISFLAPVCALVCLRCYHAHLSSYHHRGWANRTLSSCTSSICNCKLSKSLFFIKLCIFKSSITVLKDRLHGLSHPSYQGPWYNGCPKGSLLGGLDLVNS